MSDEQKFEGVFVAWVGIIDEEQGALGYQFLLPGLACEMDRARVVGTVAHVFDGATEGLSAFRPEPWVAEDPDFMAAIARNWARFQKSIRD
jgi:hypothetical protein